LVDVVRTAALAVDNVEELHLGGFRAGSWHSVAWCWWKYVKAGKDAS
jgi:hypothetical protein